jgi:hypothetical protein
VDWTVLLGVHDSKEMGSPRASSAIVEPRSSLTATALRNHALPHLVDRHRPRGPGVGCSGAWLCQMYRLSSLLAAGGRRQSGLRGGPNGPLTRQAAGLAWITMRGDRPNAGGP